MHPPEETIVALSTPPGRGAIGMIRLSGPDALAVAQSILKLRANAQIEPGKTLLATIRGRDGEDLDTGYVTYQPAGRSYTGEDVIELTCHANPVLVERILEELIASGARPAERGEFTYRAVLNGRIDLAQAEGVADLIEAPTGQAARAAREQVRGDLSRRIDSMREVLLDAIGRAEAALEFGEEPDVATADCALDGRIAALSEQVEAFVATYRRGRLLREGATVVLAGRPNAGKSSLFNRLLHTERAIVDAKPGTTRDFLSERIDLDGIPITLVDTAGLGAAGDEIERQGMQRSHGQIEKADLVVLLCPYGDALGESDRHLLTAAGSKVLPVTSKSDLAGVNGNGNGTGGVFVSAKTGAGLAELRHLIVDALSNAPAPTQRELLVTNARHHEALVACRDRLRSARAALGAGATEEIALVDLYAGLKHLEEITGAVPMDAIYDRIFSTFCVGK